MRSSDTFARANGSVKAVSALNSRLRTQELNSEFRTAGTHRLRREIQGAALG
jgi:hypothetical protein